MNKQELESRLQELQDNGFGACKDLARELEYCIIEQVLYDIGDEDIFRGNTYSIANGLIEHIFEEHLVDYIERDDE